jgi:hypothetical protein
MAGFQLAPNMQAAYDCTKTSSQDGMFIQESSSEHFVSPKYQLVFTKQLREA